MKGDGLYKTDRNSGFLWSDEKQLIDKTANIDHPYYPDSDDDSEIDERKVKSRIRNGIGTRQALKSVLEDIHADLRRFERFHKSVIEQPGGRWELEDDILPYVGDEIRDLRVLFERWDESSETRDETLREDLRECLRPMYEDLAAECWIQEFTVRERMDAAIDSENAPAGLSQSDVSETTEGIEEDMKERDARRDALTAILQDGDFYGMFVLVSGFEGQKKDEYQNLTKGGNSWKWWISRILKREYGVVEEGGWGYELTERGERIYEVIERLADDPAVSSACEQGATVPEAARVLLRRHLRTARWDDDRETDE